MKKRKSTAEMLEQEELPSYGEFMEQNEREFQSNMLKGLAALVVFVIVLLLVF
jgi:hypothetical protein